jgi:hypothetical protein
VSNSFEANSTDAASVRLQLPVADTLDPLDHPDFPENESEPLAPRREGLPPSFRMRHDRHYVEELMAPPTITHGAASAKTAQPGIPAASAPVPADRRTGAAAPPQPSTEAVDLIAGRLESIVARSAISSGQAPSTDLVNQALRVELQRVSRMARALAVTGRHLEPARRSVTAGEIAAAIRAACSRVVRLNGMDFVVTTHEASFAIAVERALIVQGIAGTIDALVDLALVCADDDGLDEDARITVSLEAARVRPALIVDVACPTLPWRGAPADRLFDNTHQAFEVAPAAGILLAAAAHVVRLHGGRVEAQMQEGLSLRFVFPSEASAATTAS